MSNRKQTRREIALQEKLERERAEKMRVRMITGGVLLVVIALIAGFVALSSSEDGGGSETVQAAASTDATPRNVTDGAIVSGTGPVKVTLYEDLQCPACKAFESATGPTITELEKAGAITVERRPLAFLDRASTDSYSTRALNAVGCVVDSAPTAVTGYISTLFDEQREEGGAGIPDTQLATLATQAGAPDVSACITELRFKGWTERQTEQAGTEGVESTPTVKVNGKVLEDRSPDGLRAAVQAAV